MEFKVKQGHISYPETLKSKTAKNLEIITSKADTDMLNSLLEKNI